MPQINQTQLLELLKNTSRTQPISLTTVTQKKGVTKEQTQNVFINAKWENVVNNALKKEGKAADFVLSERKWGKHVPNTPLIEYNGKYYLQVSYHNGKVVNNIEGVSTEYKKPDLRTFSLESIRSITLEGQTYEIV